MPKRQLIKKGQFNTYVYLWNVSTFMYHKALRQNCYHYCLAGLLFAAFTLEAYLNHIGAILFKTSWKGIEKNTSAKAKIMLISEKLGLDYDYSKRPFQSIASLIKLRNEMAHGKTEKDVKETEVISHPYRIPLTVFLPPMSDKFRKASLDELHRIRSDVESVLNLIHSRGNFDEYLFENGDWEAYID